MGRRVVFSVKIDRWLKEEFKVAVKEKGVSTCFIVETLLRAWLEGLKVSARAKVDQSKSIVVNQNIEYVVERARRKKRNPLEVIDNPEYLPKLAPGHAWCWNPRTCHYYLIDV